MTRPKRREILLRVLDLCKNVTEKDVDPFDVDVVKLFLRLRQILPELKTDEEFYLDLEAVLGLTSVILKQDEWIRYRSSLLFLDPLLVLLKVDSLDLDALADVLRRSWNPIVEGRGITPQFLSDSVEYWRALPLIGERTSDLKPLGTEPGVLTMNDLLSLGFASESELLEALNALGHRLVEEAEREGGRVPYWEFVDAPTFGEVLENVYLVSFLCSYGRATIVRNPLKDVMWLVPRRKKPDEEDHSFVVNISREGWEERIRSHEGS